MARVVSMGAPPPGAPGAPPADIPYGKLFRWGWFTVSVALGWFLVNSVLTVAVDLLTQYNVQVLAVVVSGLSGGTRAPGGGFLDPLLPRNVETAALLFASLAVALLVLRLVDRLLTAWTDTVMLGRLQQVLHDRLLRLGPRYHQAHDTGETTVILTRFAPGSQLLLRSLISFPLVQGVGLLSALVFLANNLSAVGETPIWIRVLLLGTLLVLPVGGWWLSGHVRTAFTALRQSELELVNEFTNSAAQPLEVQAMGAEDLRSRAFARRLKAFVRTKVTAALRNEVAGQFQQTTPVLLQTVFLLYGVFYALRDGNPAAAGAILGIFYFVPMAVAPIQQILGFLTGLNSAWPQVEKVVEILETEPEIQEAPGARDLDPADGSVVLQDVTFGYSPEAPPVLVGVRHVFESGRVTALVGRAGSGKSSILNLVCRLRDPDSGRVLLGDRPLREVRLASLRRHVAKVSQFPLFLADTIRANLQLARPEATDAEMEEACRRTGLWEVLERAAGPGRQPLDYVLPRTVSEGLSGGQRRLLAVTRALLWKPAVLLLDEPTTGIDALGRSRLAAILREACAGCTVILVDHSMEFVSRVADQVCCLEEGRFTDVGTPAELVARPSLFQSLLEASEESPPEGEEGAPEPPGRGEPA